eukprot:COSAG05_NODE_1212_length_5494_cov_603.311399_4_plen_57_part_00
MLTRARARAEMPQYVPCDCPLRARAWGDMRAPGSHCIFTILAISGVRGPLAGWLAD